MWVPCRTIQRADALGSLELVGADRDQVGAERGHVEVDVRGRLDRIDVQQDALVGTDAFRDLADGLDRADLVVREHDRDEDRAVREGGLELVGIHAAVPVDRQLHDLEPELLEVAQRVADRVVLDRRGDDPVAARLARPGGALEREVAGLGASRRDDDFARLRVEPSGEPVMGVVERGARRAPERMCRAGVPVRLGQERQHRVEDLATQRRRRRMVEVDRHRTDRTPPG